MRKSGLVYTSGLALIISILPFSIPGGNCPTFSNPYKAREIWGFIYDLRQKGFLDVAAGAEVKSLSCSRKESLLCNRRKKLNNINPSGTMCRKKLQTDSTGSPYTLNNDANIFKIEGNKWVKMGYPRCKNFAVLIDSERTVHCTWYREVFINQSTPMPASKFRKLLRVLKI
ncbi:hypothetical protein ACFL35_13330 [Candidatus Riflebacteria bacterium]